jgi:hypothetical protein
MHLNELERFVSLPRAQSIGQLLRIQEFHRGLVFKVPCIFGQLVNKADSFQIFL